MKSKETCRKMPVMDSNGIIFDRSGAGKSASAKIQITNILEHSKNDCVYMLDAYGEYRYLAEKLYGEVIEPSFSPVTPTHLNPLDMDLGYGTGLDYGKSIAPEIEDIRTADPIEMKADYVVSMLELMLGAGQWLDPQTKAVITRCVCLTYKPYVKHLEQLQAKDPGITCDRDSMPTLETLYDELRKQPEPEAQTVADVLENYVKGTFALFSHRSDIEAGSRFLVYSCRMFSQGLKEIVMFACLNDIWNRMLENDRNGLRTWVYIEDIDQLIYCKPTCRILSNMFFQAKAHNSNMFGICREEHMDESAKKMVEVWFTLYSLSARKIL